MLRLDERLGPCRVAIVVPNPLGFGFARMYETYATPTRIRSHVFYSREEGLVWLENEETEHAA